MAFSCDTNMQLDLEQYKVSAAHFCETKLAKLRACDTTIVICSRDDVQLFC